MAQLVRKIICTTSVAKPVAAYNQAVVVDRTVYVSGCLGMTTDGKLVSGGAADQTKKALDNLKHVLEAAESNLNQVVKTTVLITDMNDYKAVNEEYSKWFTSGYPARTCFAVKELPLKALVEIEAIAITGDLNCISKEVGQSNL